MNHRLIQASLRRFAMIATTFAIGLACVSCGGDDKPRPAARTIYPELGARKVPDFLQGTIYQYTELRNAEPYRVAGYGLVVNCDPLPNSKITPGANQYPTKVRDYMINEMIKRGVGSPNKPGWEKLSPRAMLDDVRNSIVLVQALIPPGARAGQSCDVELAALPGSTIVSLARGSLYQTDLAPRGGDPRAPGAAINIMAKAQGQVFVNPALSMNVDKGTPGQRVVLREGLILDGGYITQDRPLVLQIRTPQLSLSRQIQGRINLAFPATSALKLTAVAKDEGLIEVYVPERFNGDWEHFAGVIKYLYLSVNPARQAKMLVEEALKPGAPLMDISYAWEGLGKDVIPYIAPLMNDPRGDVSYAAARAAAFAGDRSAQDVLLRIAETARHPFQVNAVRVLGALPTAPETSLKLRGLLNSSEALVRLEAYRVLSKKNDSAIYTRVVAKGNEKFVLDLVPSSGPPMIYASRSGQPRIAVMGAKAQLTLPVLFSAMDNRLMMTSQEKDNGIVTIFYRGEEFPNPVTVLSRPDLAEIIARLGGEGPPENVNLDFGYGDVVAMLQSLADSRKLVANYDGKQVNATFMLQQLQQIPDEIRSAPPVPGPGRPQVEPSGATSSSN